MSCSVSPLSELSIVSQLGPGVELESSLSSSIAGHEFKALSSTQEVLYGTAGVSQLRNVRIEDLLVATPGTPDLTAARTDLHNRVILLTGAAGSIGSELARQIASFGPARLVLLDQAESDLYFLHLELISAHPGLDLVPVICDVTNQSRLAQVHAEHRPDYVIHAAAYKHVPLMEANVLEAVRNNVLGTLHVAAAAVRYGATKVLLLSSDKAIRPSSVMGATKRVAERIIFGLPNLHRSGTDFRAVRLGNVLGSKGSVIPLFQRQLAAGGPITITHPQAQRYFTTLPAAAQLVLQAGSLAETAGSIAMLDMGEPVRIVDLAEKLIRFSGKVPGRDIEIVFTGLRPGEKLGEDQMSAVEPTVATSTEKIRVSRTPESAEPDHLVQMLSRLFASLDAGNRESVLSTLCDLVPECVSPLRECHRPRIAASNGKAADAWAAMVESGEARWRERRRGMQRMAEPQPLTLLNRREREVCRRKTPRLGGRRRTDVGALLATGTSSDQSPHPASGCELQDAR